jgi:hypothetical protein
MPSAARANLLRHEWTAREEVAALSTLELLEQRAEEATRHADKLTRMLALAKELGEDGLSELVALIGHPTEETNGHGAEDAPRGREAVRIIVRERPGIWAMQDLRAEMEARGWFTSASGLEAAVKRLCDVNREGRRIGRGRYVFPANHGEEAAIESDPSGGAMIPLTH